MIIWSIKLVHKAKVLAMQKHHIRPTLEGRIPIGSFGTPKTFRVPQNTTLLTLLTSLIFLSLALCICKHLHTRLLEKFA